MKKLKYKNKEVDLPETWDELSRKQYLKICHILGEANLNPTDQEALEVNNSAALILIIKELLQMNWFTFFKVSKSQLACLLPITGFITKEVSVNKQYLPSFRIWGFKYAGPSKGCRQTSMAEFSKADNYFIQCCKGEDPDAIFKLAATLYRPQKTFHFIRRLTLWYNGDNRIAYNDQQIERRAEIFKKRLSKRKLFAILYFYWGFRNTNVLIFKNLFPEPTKNKVEHSGPQFGWAGTMLEMSGDKFGDFDKTSKERWSTIFVEMSRQMSKHQEQEMNNKLS